MDDITDGFGNWWSKCDLPNCDLHVVRPGDARCDASFCKLGQEWTSESDDIAERLQNLLDGPIPWHITRQDIREAITEIEQLRAEIAAMRRQALQNMIRHAEHANMYNHD